MRKLLKKITNIISIIALTLLVALAILLGGTRLIGWELFIVLSGSMEPAYHTGSVIFVKEVDPYLIEEGDVITFMLSETTIVTHRVVGVVPDEEDAAVVRFRTKGDANSVEDGTLVHYKSVIGSPVFTIPYLGYVVSYIKQPPGLYAAISVGALLILLVLLPEFFEDYEDEETHTEKKNKKKKKKR